MQNELVFEKKGSAFTSSIIIAEKSSVQHESVVRMISNNISDFEEYGRVEFSDLKSGKRGRPTRVYSLNCRFAHYFIPQFTN